MKILEVAIFVCALLAFGAFMGVTFWLSIAGYL